MYWECQFLIAHAQWPDAFVSKINTHNINNTFNTVFLDIFFMMDKIIIFFKT